MVGDVRFIQGVKLAEEERWDEAAVVLAELLELRHEDGVPELDPALAPLYLEYGTVLLNRAEAAGTVLGSAAEDAEREKIETAAKAVHAKALADCRADEAKASSSDPGSAASRGEPDAGKQENGGGGGGGGAAAEDKAGLGAEEADDVGAPDTEEDLEISWEVLDLARVIYEKMQDGSLENKKALARAYARLGSHKLLTGHCAEAAEEFKKCLELRQTYLPPNSRLLADVHHELYTAYFYNVTGLTDLPAKISTLDSAIAHLDQAKAILQNIATEMRTKLGLGARPPSAEKRLVKEAAAKEAAAALAAAKASASGSGGSGQPPQTEEEVLFDVEDLVDTLEETLAEVKMRRNAIAEEEGPSGGRDALAAAGGGGGAASNGVPSPFETVDGAGGSAPAAPVAQLQVKRKAKPVADMPEKRSK